MAGQDGYRVLIVGCGQLGSRHLQAVASMPEIGMIEVVDSRPDALDLGRERLSELPEVFLTDKVRWLSSMDEATKQGDLCIVATQAVGRCELVKQAAQFCDYSSFLVEKIVSQSVTEIESLIEFAEDQNLGIWVNCQSRAYPIHQKAKKLLGSDEPVMFSVMGGNHGLANNGIHHADLFAFYDETNEITGAGSDIHPVLHDSKRGDGLFDLSGSLHGRTEKGSSFAVSYAAGHQAWEHLSIGNSHHRFFVDHLSETIMESDSESGWQWRQTQFKGSTRVSETTKDIAKSIIVKGESALPTLKESLVAHRYILDELLPHFSRLIGKDLDRCPVT